MIFMYNPADTRRRNNAGLTLVHRLRRWTNVIPALILYVLCVLGRGGLPMCVACDPVNTITLIAYICVSDFETNPPPLNTTNLKMAPALFSLFLARGSMFHPPLASLRSKEWLDFTPCLIGSLLYLRYKFLILYMCPLFLSVLPYSGCNSALQGQNSVYVYCKVSRLQLGFALHNWSL